MDNNPALARALPDRLTSEASRKNKYSKDWVLALQQPKRNGKELMKKKEKLIPLGENIGMTKLRIG